MRREIAVKKNNCTTIKYFGFHSYFGHCAYTLFGNITLLWATRKEWFLPWWTLSGHLNLHRGNIFCSILKYRVQLQVKSDLTPELAICEEIRVKQKIKVLAVSMIKPSFIKTVTSQCMCVQKWSAYECIECGGAFPLCEKSAFPFSHFWLGNVVGLPKKICI